MFGKKRIDISSIAYNAHRNRKAQRKAAKQIGAAIKKGSDPNMEDITGWRALHWAAKYNWHELVDILMKGPRYEPVIETDINIQAGLGGPTPLIIAIQNDSGDFVKKLMEYPQTDLEIQFEGMNAIGKHLKPSSCPRYSSHFDLVISS